MKHLGRYRLDAVQGVGAFATVWRGFDTELEVPVAVKVLADNWSHHADVRERFLAEARLLRKIVDPRVVRVHDVGVEDDRPYFVMDFVAGGTVEDLIGKVDLPDALELAAECARAVHALHEHDVLHRDVKPSNLLLNPSVGSGQAGRVLVSDLGSAKRLAEASGITVTTGTPAYMAPEQARGDALDARCDVFALGVVACELATGKPPTDRSPSTGAGSIVDKVIAGALAPKPTDRTPTAADFADALDRARSTVAPTTVPVWLVVMMTLAGFASSAVTTWWLGR